MHGCLVSQPVATAVRTRWAGGLERSLQSVYYVAMVQTIRAIYENGIFRPLETPNLAEREHVRLTVEPDSSSDRSSSADNESADPLAGLRVSTGISDLAENFDDYRFGKRHP